MSNRSTQIYISRDGQQFGPYSIDQARSYMASGNLLAGDLAWHEDVADWLPLAQGLGVASATSLQPVTASAPAPQPSWVPPRRKVNWSQTVTMPGQVPRNVPLRGTVAKPQKTISSFASSDKNDFSRRSLAG